MSSVNKSLGLKNIPRHVAIIMDGNGRWAKARGLPRIEGHKQGAKSVEHAIRAAGELGIQYLTLYAFSVENWSRPKSEVRALMNLLVGTLRENLPILLEHRVALKTIGRLSDLPRQVVEEIQRVAEATILKAKTTLILALSYGGRMEIVEACRSLAHEAREGLVDPGAIDEKLFASRLSTAGIPDPDLLIRTSGEMRVSNFLLWQLSYTEIFVTRTLWPDFRKRHFVAAIREYNTRQRRFGRV